MRKGKDWTIDDEVNWWMEVLPQIDWQKLGEEVDKAVEILEKDGNPLEGEFAIPGER